MNGGVGHSHGEVFCGKMIASIGDEDAVTGFCQVLGAYAAAAAGTYNDDVGVDDLLVVSRRQLQEVIVEILARFAVKGCSRKAKDRVYGGALLDIGRYAQGWKCLANPSQRREVRL